jgi:hypothetical protein
MTTPDEQAFLDHLEQLCAEQGIAFGPDILRAVYQQAGGIVSPAHTEAAFAALNGTDDGPYDEDDFDDDELDLDDDVDQDVDQEQPMRDLSHELLERDTALAFQRSSDKLGRKLTQAEIERVAESLPAQTGFNERITAAHMEKRSRRPASDRSMTATTASAG